jgi:hypothetical protein
MFNVFGNRILMKNNVLRMLFSSSIFRFFWHYFIDTPCFLFHEFCHFVALFALYPFLKINKINTTVKYKLGLWECSVTVNFNSKYKLVKFLVIVAPLIGSFSLYFLFVIKMPILAFLIFILIYFSKLGLSEIDKNSLRELLF